jgi:hypothetical protein
MCLHIDPQIYQSDMKSFFDINKSKNLDKSKYFQIIVSGSGSFMIVRYIFMLKKFYFLEKFELKNSTHYSKDCSVTNLLYIPFNAINSS